MKRRNAFMVLCLVLTLSVSCVLSGCSPEVGSHTEGPRNLTANLAVPAPVAGRTAEEASVTVLLDGQAAEYKYAWYVLDGDYARPMEPGEAFENGKYYSAEIRTPLPPDIREENVELRAEAGAVDSWAVSGSDLTASCRFALETAVFLNVAAPTPGQPDSAVSGQADGEVLETAHIWYEQSPFTGEQQKPEEESFLPGLGYRAEITWRMAPGTVQELVALDGEFNGGVPGMLTVDSDGICRMDVAYGPSESASPCSHAYRVSEYTEGTCLTPESRTYTCALCGDSYTQRKNTPNGHGHYTPLQNWDATCTEEGRVRALCGDCGEEFIIIVPAKGHAELKELENQEATCTEDGICTLQCPVCGYTETTVTPALGHGEKKEITRVDASCTAAGFVLYRCERCGMESQEILRATGHSTYVLTEHKDPGCTQEGFNAYRCPDCGDIQRDPIPAKGHHVEHWQYSAAEFEHFGICTLCGETIREAHRAEYHSVGETSHEVRCAVCGMVEEQLHAFDEEGICTRCGEKQPRTAEMPAEPEEP